MTSRVLWGCIGALAIAELISFAVWYVVVRLT